MEAFPVFIVHSVFTCKKTFPSEFFVKNFDALTVKDYPNNKNLVNYFEGLYRVRRNILGHIGCADS